MQKWIYLFLIVVLVKVDLSAQITSSPDTLKAQLNKAKKEHDYEMVVNLYTDIGKYYSKNEQYDRALEYLCKAKQVNEEYNLNKRIFYAGFSGLFKRIGAISAAIEYDKRIFNLREMNLGMYFSAANVGIGYLYLNERDSALRYMNEQLFVANKLKNYIAIASAYNNIGIVYLENDEYAQALNYFLKAEKKLIEKQPDTGDDFKNELESFTLSVQENKGKTFCQLKRYKDAIAILKKIADSGRYKSVDNNIYALFKSYVKLGKIPEANHLLTKYSPQPDANVDNRILFTKMKLELAIQLNNINAVNTHHAELQNLYEEQLIERRLNENRTSEFVGKYLLIEMNQRLKNESEKSQFYASKLTFAKTRYNFMIFISVTLILLISISVYVYLQNVKNKKRKLKLDYDTLQMENEKHEYKIKLQENILTEFAIDYNRNKQEEDSIIQKLKNLSNAKTPDFKGELNTIIAEIKMRQSINEKIEVVSRESLLLQQEFQQKLLSVNPNLTKNEIQLCFLLRLELTNKEIALYRNVTVDSIKVFKNRLRSKLNLSGADLLVDFLKSI